MRGKEAEALLAQLTLHGPAADARLTEALTGFPQLTRTLDGASTLELVVSDYSRTLVQSGIVSARSWATVSGVGYELVSVSKGGDALALTFEDSLVAALRRKTAARAWAAGSTTRAQIIAELAQEATVPSLVDPGARGTVAGAVERKAPAEGEDGTDSWALMGTLASDVKWRRFSDGLKIIAGSDDWLMKRYTTVTVREYREGVHDIDFKFDVGQKESTATIEVDSDSWALPVGAPVALPDLGPASGDWLVQKVTRELTRTRATIDLIRATPALPEPPPPDPTPTGEPANGGDSGETDYIPGSRAPAPAPSAAPSAGNSARERFVNAALSKAGGPYVWGGTGPRGYDCSGLVQFAARVAGKPISRVVSTQWADSRRGQRISVAQAIRTRGAILTRLGGYGDHTAISLGNGKTIEARGKAYLIGSYPSSASRGWTGAYLWV